MQLFKFFFGQQPLDRRLVLPTVRILSRIHDPAHGLSILFSMQMGVLVIASALSLYEPRTIIASGLI